MEGEDRGDHGFLDEPTKLFFLDVDGMQINWRANPERAIRNIVAQLGEPWASTSFVWFFSAKHGLEFVDDGRKHWTGKIIDGKLYARIVFITERALNEAEASALTNIAKVHVPKLDAAISRLVQPNYIGDRIGWSILTATCLATSPSIGWVEGRPTISPFPTISRTRHAGPRRRDTASTSPTTPTRRRRCAASAATDGCGSICWRPSSTCCSPIGARGRELRRPRRRNRRQLQAMIEQHRAEIEANLARHGRRWADVLHYLAGMADWAHWLLDHPAALNSKTIRLVKEERAKADANGDARGDLCTRRAHHRAGMLRAIKPVCRIRPRGGGHCAGGIAGRAHRQLQVDADAQGRRALCHRASRPERRDLHAAAPAWATSRSRAAGGASQRQFQRRRLARAATPGTPRSRRPRREDVPAGRRRSGCRMRCST